jgi:hypothetical protein
MSKRWLNYGTSLTWEWAQEPAGPERVPTLALDAFPSTEHFRVRPSIELQTQKGPC